MDRKAQVAQQLRALMDRHHVDEMDIERRTTDPRTGRNAVSNVTVRRILKQEAKTEPSSFTLRRIAEACGETFAQAFPEAPAAAPPETSAIVVERIPGSARLALKRTGEPLAPEVERAIQMVINGHNATVEPIHEEKRRQRRKRGSD